MCLYYHAWEQLGVVVVVSTTLAAHTKPYEKCYMNFSDAILLFYSAIFSFILSIRWPDNNTVVIARMLLSTPIIPFFNYYIQTNLYHCCTKCAKTTWSFLAHGFEAPPSLLKPWVIKIHMLKDKWQQTHWYNQLLPLSVMEPMTMKLQFYKHIKIDRSND